MAEMHINVCKHNYLTKCPSSKYALVGTSESEKSSYPNSNQHLAKCDHTHTIFRFLCIFLNLFYAFFLAMCLILSLKIRPTKAPPKNQNDDVYLVGLCDEQCPLFDSDRCFDGFLLHFVKYIFAFDKMPSV